MTAAVRQTPAPLVNRTVCRPESVDKKDLPPSFPAFPYQMRHDLYRQVDEGISHRTGIERISPYQLQEWFLEPLYANSIPMMFDCSKGLFYSRNLTAIPALLFADDIRDSLSQLAISSVDECRWLHLMKVHNVDKNAAHFSAVVIDFVDGNKTYDERREILEKCGPNQLGIRERPEAGKVHLVPRFDEDMSEDVWAGLHLMNQEWKETIYEGVILKKSDSFYPINLTSAMKATLVWHQHRFAHYE